MSLVVAGRVALSLALGSVLLVGCARFDDSAASPFTPEPTFAPANPKAPKSTQKPPPRPEGPCIDPDPAVVSTCLDSTGGIVALGDTALVAERRTGRILKSVPVGESDPQVPPVEIAKLDVDAAGDGGITDLALSPTYHEDGLIYAYITTPSDNRVVRIAAGGQPKDILTGIPKGATGNHGALEFVSDTELLILSGDAGNPGLASTPSSLAGKVLRVKSPAPGASPEVVMSGLGMGGDLCFDGSDSTWVTDRTATEDRLQRLAKDGSVSVGWTWPDRPGVAGCAAGPEMVAIAMSGAKALAIAEVDPKSHAITTQPALTSQDKYGRLGGAAAANDGAVWVATVNNDDNHGPFDDRVVKIPPPSGGGGTPD
ncbi:sorbosone dehydrogenase family protein [Nocardia sp. XZ_19_385]|uniref:PQQ-dependent sugar dehydrogenase n=1 Tax=Nocardia sp. XZ_19_385 TaxID=2769488 RepID=UPI00188EAF52|nr:PQQ-dependent sugar dehydrogenase [Nocardia sp. XZ_19_385]